MHNDLGLLSKPLPLKMLKHRQHFYFLQPYHIRVNIGMSKCNLGL